jgi:hypothetical protein
MSTSLVLFPRPKLPLLWLTATIAAAPMAGILTIVGIKIGYEVQTLAHLDLFPLSLQAIIGFLFFGLAISTAQWLVLRNVVRAAWHWIAISAFALPLAMQTADLLVRHRSTLEGILSFTLLSFIQSLFFRTRTKRPYLWIVFHVVSPMVVALLPNVPSDGIQTLGEALAGVLLTGAMFAIPGAAALIFMPLHTNVAPPNNSMEPTRPAAPNRVHDRL